MLPRELRLVEEELGARHLVVVADEEPEELAVVALEDHGELVGLLPAQVRLHLEVLGLDAEGAGVAPLPDPLLFLLREPLPQVLALALVPLLLLLLLDPALLGEEALLPHVGFPLRDPGLRGGVPGIGEDVPRPLV